MRRGASRKSAERRKMAFCPKTGGTNASTDNSNRRRAFLLPRPMLPPSPQSLHLDAIASETENHYCKVAYGQTTPPPLFASAHSNRLSFESFPVLQEPLPRSR